jgi:hypothetical protein
MRRNATAVWNGTIKEGKGHLTTQSTTLNQTQYSLTADLKTEWEQILKNYWQRLTQDVSP